jgi:hypothetical protein
MPTCITVLSTVARLWNQTACLPVDEWVKRMWHYTHKGVLVSHKEE